MSDDRDIAHIDDLQNAIAGHRPDLSPTRLAEHGRWCGSQKQDFDIDKGSFTRAPCPAGPSNDINAPGTEVA